MDEIVFRDQRFTLGRDDDTAYLLIADKKFRLTSHPYEPCLYITGEDGFMTVVHNAFVPEFVLDSFSKGETVTSITGREYDAKDFCEMAAYAAHMGDVNIDSVEKVFSGRPEKKSVADAYEPDGVTFRETKNDSTGFVRPESGETPDDPFYDLIAEYPDSVVDFCIVKNNISHHGYSSHLCALATACEKLFTDGDESMWEYDVDKANGSQIRAQTLFAADDGTDNLNYRSAFLNPPNGNSYHETDFKRINAALFPNGTDGLEVYEWSTDWSDYFDDGHEWWGALCLTVYDRSLDRFVVILASATD